MLCDVTNRETGAVKMATAEEIKLLVTSKNLAMLLMVVTGIKWPSHHHWKSCCPLKQAQQVFSHAKLA